MPEIDVRLDTGELDVKLRLHTERAIPILDIEFAKGVTVNGSPDSYREFAQDLLDLIDATCPPPRNEYGAEFDQVYEATLRGETIERDR